MSRHPAVQLTQDLVRTNSINPPGQEEHCVRLLAERLSKSGFEIDFSFISQGRPNLVARLRGSTRAPALCFSGHLDTVPLGTKFWTRPPLRGDIDNGRIWGRGTSDMKSGVAAFVVAAEAFAKQADRTADILLILTAAEETGCEGANLIAESPDKHGKVGAIVVAEPTSNRVMHGHKGATWVKLTAKGKAAHGSRPELGINAIYRLADAIGILRSFQFSDEAHPLLGVPSLNVGTIAGGQNVNSVPDTATLTLDVRTVWANSSDQTLREIAYSVGPDIEVKKQVSVSSLSTDADNPWVKRVESITQAITQEPQSPCAAAFFTDGAVLSQAFALAPTLLLGPGEPAQAHQTDEWCSVSKIEDACAIYRMIIEDWQRGFGER